MKPQEKSKLLTDLADLVDKHADALGRIETLNLGMPIGDATGCAHLGAQTLRYYAGWPDKIAGDTLPAVQPGLFTSVPPEPSIPRPLIGVLRFQY